MQSLERGLRVLDHLNLVGFATNSEIARALGLKRATVHRITAVLVDVGLLHLDRPSSLLTLTAAVTSLSRRLQNEPRIDGDSQPAHDDWGLVRARLVESRPNDLRPRGDI